MSAALFHEHCAAELGIKEAIVTLASIHLGLPHELLVNVYLEVSVLPWHCTSFCVIVQVFNLIVSQVITVGCHYRVCYSTAYGILVGGQSHGS